MLSVGARVYGRRQTDQKIVCATISEIFFDDEEVFYITLPQRFLETTSGEFYLNRNLNENRKVLILDNFQLSPESKTGFVPVPLHHKVVLDVSTYEFTDLVPSTLSSVTSEEFSGYVVSQQKPVKAKNSNRECVLVSFTTTGDQFPVVGDLCTTNNLAWGAVFAVSRREQIAAVMPLRDIYEEFSALALSVAPSSEIERRRRQASESSYATHSEKIAAVWEFLAEIADHAKLVEIGAFPKYSFDDLVFRIQCIRDKIDLETKIETKITEFGNLANKRLPLRDFLEPGELLASVFLDLTTSQIIYLEPPVDTPDLISVATMLQEVVSEPLEAA